MQNKRKALMVITAAVGINLVGGIVYCWSIISKELIINFGWTNTQASLPYTFCIAMIALFTAIGGRVRDKKGPRLGATIGCVLMGGGLFISSFNISPVLMVITYGIVFGAGWGFAGSTTTVTAIKWFPAERSGVVSGVCMAGIALAAVYISPIIQILISQAGIYKTFQYTGIGAFIIILFFSFFLAEPPEPPSSTETPGGGRENILKRLSFYKLWSVCLLGTSVGLIIIGNIAVIALRQAGWEKGFLLVILLSVFNGTGRIICGLIFDKIGVRKTLLIVLLLQAVNMALFNSYKTVALLCAGSAAAGFFYGGLIASFPAGTAIEFGTKNLGVNYGFVNTAFGFAGILGPIIAGRIVDTTGNYSYVYITAIVFLGIAAAVAATLKK